MSRKIEFGKTHDIEKEAGRAFFVTDDGKTSISYYASIIELHTSIFKTGAIKIEDGIYGAYIGRTRVFFELHKKCGSCGYTVVRKKSK